MTSEIKINKILIKVFINCDLCDRQTQADSHTDTGIFTRENKPLSKGHFHYGRSTHAGTPRKLNVVQLPSASARAQKQIENAQIGHLKV